MGTKEKIRRVFSLKKVVVTPNAGGTTFKDLVCQAMTRHKHAKDRRFKLEEDSDRYRVLNNFDELGVNRESCAMSVFAFTMNANMNAAVVSGKGVSYPIEELAPPRNSKKRSEFVEGLVWMAVMGDYAAVMTNQAVSFSVLEDYFSWFLKPASGETVSVAFTDPARPKVKDYDMTSVNNIMVGNSLADLSPEPIKKVDHVPLSGMCWDAIKSVLSNLGAKVPDFELDDAKTYQQIGVDLVIYVKRTGDRREQALAKIQKIAEAFRDVDNAPVTFNFPDGRRLSLSEYRIAKSVSLEAKNGIPIAATTIKELDEWLRGQIAELRRAKTES